MAAAAPLGGDTDALQAACAARDADAVASLVLSGTLPGGDAHTLNECLYVLTAAQPAQARQGRSIAAIRSLLDTAPAGLAWGGHGLDDRLVWHAANAGYGDAVRLFLQRGGGDPAGAALLAAISGSGPGYQASAEALLEFGSRLSLRPGAYPSDSQWEAFALAAVAYIHRLPALRREELALAVLGTLAGAPPPPRDE
jgi:hypothetical protein